MTAHVVCFLPGVMGSELRLGKKLVWPGPVQSLVGSYKLMKELLDPATEPTDIIRSFSVSTQYAAIIADLERCRFRLDDDPPTLVLVPYDWRKDNALAAKRLADHLDAIFAAHASACRISIVAHSMGGLVSRYYLESGEFSSRPAFAAVRQLITLGTPHRGAPLAFTAALGMEKRLFLSADQVKTLVNDDRYPAVYQLLPPEDEPFLWDEAAAAEYSPIPLSADLIAKLGLSAANVKSARDFRTKLDIARRPKGVRYFFFIGSRQQTTCAALLLQQQRVRKIDQDDAGDGTVPIWSGSLNGVQSRPVGGEHGSIYKNAELRSTLATLLGHRGVLAVVGGGVEIAIRDHVVNPGAPLPFVLTPSPGATELEGDLRIDRLLVDDSGITSIVPLGVTRRIVYRGLAAERLSLVTEAPKVPGIYRLTFQVDGIPGSAGSDDFFVQEEEV